MRPRLHGSPGRCGGSLARGVAAARDLVGHRFVWLVRSARLIYSAIAGRIMAMINWGRGQIVFY